MTPPTKRKSVSRFFLSAAFFTLAAAYLPPSHAASEPAARGNLKGLFLPFTVPTLRDRLVEVSLQAIGTRYHWGGDDPSGFDCSGLVSFVYKEVAGVDLPRRAQDQRSVGEVIKTAQMEPGDLVFFATNRRRNQTSHVGLYIGNGQFVHAPTRGSSVRIDDLNSAYWSEHFSGARRYVDENQDDAPAIGAKPDEVVALDEQAGEDATKVATADDAAAAAQPAKGGAGEAEDTRTHAASHSPATHQSRTDTHRVASGRKTAATSSGKSSAKTSAKSSRTAAKPTGTKNSKVAEHKPSGSTAAHKSNAKAQHTPPRAVAQR
jgi:hypothetical protein